MPIVKYTYDLDDPDDAESQRVHDRAQDFKRACEDIDEWLRAIRKNEGEDATIRLEGVFERLWEIFNDNGIAEMLL